MKTMLIATALLLALVVPVVAQTGADFPIVVTSSDGQGLFYVSEVVYHSPGSSVAYFGPSDGATFPVNLGNASAPFHRVYAERVIVNGLPGLTKDVTLPGGCVLHVQGGIIVGTTNLVVNNGGC